MIAIVATSGTPKFPLGSVCATPGALEAIQESGQEPLFFLAKHVSGDWGIVGAEVWKENDFSLQNGLRILSAYRTLKGVRLLVITEADRSSTTILLPDEY